jgi:hypothetical protein
MPSATKSSATVVLQDPVGLREIARRLHVSPNTVRVWRVRNRFPAPVCKVSNVPLWPWPQVERWAADTGRLQRLQGAPAKPAPKAPAKPAANGSAARTPAKEAAKAPKAPAKPAPKAPAKAAAKPAAK